MASKDLGYEHAAVHLIIIVHFKSQMILPFFVCLFLFDFMSPCRVVIYIFHSQYKSSHSVFFPFSFIPVMLFVISDSDQLCWKEKKTKRGQTKAVKLRQLAKIKPFCGGKSLTG